MKICFVLSQFPETHETFILREFIAFERAGLDFFIISLKKCRDKIVHPQAKRFLDRTVYFDAKGAMSALGRFASSPVASSALLPRAAALACNSLSPVKTLASMPFSLWCAAVAKKNKASAIHSHWATFPTTVAMEASAITGIPFSFTAHAWDIFAGDGLLAPKLARARFAISCTAYNVNVLKNITRAADGRVYLAYHGLECKKMKAAHHAEGEHRLRLFSIGRLVEQKGFEYLIKALGGLKERGLKFQSTIVGDGPLKEKLVGLVKKAGLIEDVAFAGTISFEEIKEHFSNSDCFVLPCVVARNNDRDGIPNVILEAMAAGLPVVSTSVSGIPEAVKHNVTGILVQQRNAKALENALVEIAGDPQKRRQFGEAGKIAAARTFDLEVASKILIDIFRREYGAG